MGYTIKKTSKKDGTYYLAAWTALDATGQRKIFYERYEGPDGKRGATKLANLREAEAANSDQAANHRMTFDRYLLDVWHPRNSGAGQSYSTKYSKERISMDLAQIIGPKPLGDITALDFGTVTIALEKRGLAGSTINNQLKVMKRALKDAHNWKLIDSRPWEGVKAIKPKKAPPRVVTRADGLRVAEALRKEGDAYTADVVKVLAFTGLRLSEALGIHWDDIDWDRGTIRIWRITTRTGDPKNRIQIQESPKTSAGNRTLPMASSVREVFERRKETVKGDLIFPDAHGKPAYSSDVTKKISRQMKAMGIRGTAHGLRHGAITHLLESGVSLNQVSKLAGHESSDITAKIYLAWADDDTAIEAMRLVMDE